ncbi:MAG TPA: TIGR00730 family Rossman fold protein [Planctomycetaceae bacterium]|nr:TIGR00730 family Rossman fold protein [Planctomycetaceae bacterium]
MALSLRRVCVFCGSKVGADERYRAAAVELGQLLVQSGIGLVYGGGSVGLMGVIADAVLDAGGEVIGVIPEALATEELLHPRVPDMRVVTTMHARKALMAELSDAFVALPGGFGTFEELFEVVTWSQLRLHRKLTGLLNVGGYYDPLVRLVDHAVQEGFIKVKHRGLLVIEERPDVLLRRLSEETVVDEPKWS